MVSQTVTQGYTCCLDLYCRFYANIWAPQAGPSHLQAFLTVLRNVTKEDTVQYVLALLDDTLTGQGLLACYFLGHGSSGGGSNSSS